MQMQFDLASRLDRATKMHKRIYRKNTPYLPKLGTYMYYVAVAT